MHSVSSLPYAAVSVVPRSLWRAAFAFDNQKEKLEKALAYEDSMAQSAKQTGLEVMGSSHISASKELFESRRQCKDWNAASEAAAAPSAQNVNVEGLSPIYSLNSLEISNNLCTRKPKVTQGN